MKTIIFLTVQMLLNTLSVFAQNQQQTNPDADAPSNQRLALKVEYFGELVLHPGMCIGAEQTLMEKKWTTIHWDNEIGGYWHRWNNTSLFAKTSVGSRFAMGSIYADLIVGVGYMHSWAAGDVYASNGVGSVERVTNWGHSHFMATSSLLIGWDGSKKAHLPWKVYIGPEVYLQSSFNHIFLPHVAAKVGFTYKIK